MINMNYQQDIIGIGENLPKFEKKPPRDKSFILPSDSKRDFILQIISLCPEIFTTFVQVKSIRRVKKLLDTNKNPLVWHRGAKNSEQFHQPNFRLKFPLFAIYDDKFCSFSDVEETCSEYNNEGFVSLRENR